MEAQTLTMTPLKAESLVKKHNESVLKGGEDFYFEGNVLLTEYAHYVIEYCKMRKLIDGDFASDGTFKLKKHDDH